MKPVSLLYLWLVDAIFMHICAASVSVICYFELDLFLKLDSGQEDDDIALCLWSTTVC